MSNSTAYFISDAHLGINLGSADHREADLRSWLRTIAADADFLFIVGDLFDFWIEYKTVIRLAYVPFLLELQHLVDSGVQVHYIAGNHDFALGSFLQNTMGITIHTNSYETVLQDKKIYLFHGDGLLKADVGYRILKKILRNPLNQKLFKLIHPDAAIKLATFCSGSSRHLLSKFFNNQIRDEYRQHAKKILAQGNDIVILGHTHHADLVKYPEGIYCNTGEWIKRYNYARLHNGRLELFESTPGTAMQPIAPESIL